MPAGQAFTPEKKAALQRLFGATEKDQLRLSR
jgi:hypothetical protein